MKLQQKKCHAFFFPLLAKELAQSQPVTVWNPRRVLHNLSPMCIMHWNKTAFIIHVGVKPQFRPVQASKKSMVEIKHAELYHSSHAFFFYFWHCLGTGLAVTLICTFEANGCFPLLKLTPFNGIHSALLKDHVDLQTVVRKEQGTEDVEIFFR